MGHVTTIRHRKNNSNDVYFDSRGCFILEKFLFSHSVSVNKGLNKSYNPDTCFHPSFSFCFCLVLLSLSFFSCLSVSAPLYFFDKHFKTQKTCKPYCRTSKEGTTHGTKGEDILTARQLDLLEIKIKSERRDGTLFAKGPRPL